MKILARVLRNTEELILNIKMFSNWEWKVLPFKCVYVSPVLTVKVVKTLQTYKQLDCQSFQDLKKNPAGGEEVQEGGYFRGDVVQNWF